MKKLFLRFVYMEEYNASFKKAEGKLSSRGKTAQKTRRLAICALLSAFVTVILLLGNLSGVLDLTALAVASAVTVFCVIEFGGAYPYLVWGVVSVCAFLFLPNKLLACEYFLFAGLYPIVKHRLSRLSFKISFPLKLLIFNVVLTLCAVVSVYLLALPAEAGLSLGVMLYAGGNALFVLYDFALTSVTTYYIVKLRRPLRADRL